MRRTANATLAGLLLTAPCFIGPAAAQAPNVQQLLQGLLSGNQSQDQALQDAFERGYQRGREDEARRARAERDRDDRAGPERRRSRRDDAQDLERGEYGSDQRPYRGEREPARPAETYYGR